MVLEGDAKHRSASATLLAMRVEMLPTVSIELSPRKDPHPEEAATGGRLEGWPHKDR
jgi:hypothetical protein